MIKTYKILPLAAAAAIALSACDNVDPEDRFIHIDRVHSDKVVLVQEFSGMNCTYCPEGADVLHGLLNAYPEEIAVVTMHPYGSEQSEPLSGSPDLRNDLSTEYFKFYGSPSAFPAAIFDATPYKGNTVLTSRGEWSPAFLQQQKIQTPLDLSITPVYDADSRKLTVDYSIKFTSMVSQPISIVVWLTESDIIGAQRTLTGITRRYKHQHILRCGFNGTWGDELGKSFLPDDTKQGTVECTLAENWKPENCEVVAAVILTGPKTVQQAAKASVLKND